MADEKADGKLRFYDMDTVVGFCAVSLHCLSHHFRKTLGITEELMESVVESFKPPEPPEPDLVLDECEVVEVDEGAVDDDTEDTVH